ncbi:MFS transporter [Altererythrobacter xixiisoli]|uniref:MFS transporter n=1 Tax=Croceibacterium xixiisoli TaxID=1476466 RepID=A0A6I4TZ84_9SPHN|nr:MFS transporter [Croceibacterium xixiisoli]MXO99928.1 MFS transporter [Croceibacterium xixiisoli]
MLAPQTDISDAEREAGLSRLVYEAGYSSATAALTSGVILTAFALHLGASNLQVGILASAPFLGQLFQAPAVLLVDRIRKRKAIAVISSIMGRSMLALMALALFLPPGLAMIAVIFAQFVLCGLGAIGGCAWNGWLRDLAPQERLGTLFSQRMVYTTSVTLIAGLAAALLLDRTTEGSSARDWAFAGLYAAGCVSGMISAFVVARMPEPSMPPPSVEPLGLGELLRTPFADRNFRRLIRFLASWQFAVNLATPFFTVFIVRQLQFDMTFVVVLSVVSQITNLASVRAWGALSDRFAHKSVLAVAAPTYIFSIVAMVGASQLGNSQMGMAYLVALHMLMGAAVAGVTLATASIALKLSPRGEATAYVATSALTSSLAAGIAPILGGLFADFFAARRFELLVRWTDPGGTSILSPITLSNWDFYFIGAGLLGLYALHRLSFVEEEGQIDRREMVQQVWFETRRAARNLGTVSGLRALTEFPGSFVRDARVRVRWLRKQRHAAMEN